MTEIVTLLILIFSIVLHEVAHGYAAHWLGDPTARLAGRLTVNPLKHIDPLGSIVIPAFLFFSGAQFLFGWAKPVPYNPYNLRNQKWGESFVAAAGPLTNLFLAIVFAVFIRLAPVLGVDGPMVEMFGYIVFINVLLAVFNAIPFPPLDGSKVIVPFLPFGLAYRYQILTKYIESLGFIALFSMVFIFMYIFAKPFSILVLLIGSFLTGLSPYEFSGLIYH